MLCPHCGGYIETIEGYAKGGRKSRRTLTTEQARAMVVARETAKAKRLLAQVELQERIDRNGKTTNI